MKRLDHGLLTEPTPHPPFQLGQGALAMVKAAGRGGGGGGGGGG